MKSGVNSADNTLIILIKARIKDNVFTLGDHVVSSEYSMYI